MRKIAWWFLSRFLTSDDVLWIVNDISELGVRVGSKNFFLYKGYSLCYDEENHAWRQVFKREFGECCHPWDAIKHKSGEERLPYSYVGFFGEDRIEWHGTQFHDDGREAKE